MEPEEGLVCTAAEQRDIIQWTSLNFNSFIANGPGRRFQLLPRCAGLSRSATRIRDRIIDLEGLREFEGRPPALADFVSHISGGGQIHPHRDPNSDNLIHTRFNVFVQLPEAGGRPIYAQVRFDPAERSYLPCVAGRDLHTCEPVEGKKARIVLSFGFLVSEDWLIQRGV